MTSEHGNVVYINNTNEQGYKEYLLTVLKTIS